MKKLMFAIAAILMMSMSSCRNNDVENVNEEIAFEKLKTNEEPPKTAARDSLPQNPDTGLGPIVITPPR
ncbi:hypothetical protein [Chryseobacterium sp. YIM B08800]|uniref:hypothetical protein n=1 Tax=Chryseobacterium sp. YIM B08800 TaxID=2984136 RepID=UPI00223F0322|nr:hypothetical protein [Chryseobacterium sp. YIM B08800]